MMEGTAMNNHTDTDGNALDETDLHTRYDEMLDEVYPVATIGGMSYAPSYALGLVDPIAYRTGFNDWLDSEITEGTIIETD